MKAKSDKPEYVMWYGANIQDVKLFCGAKAKAKWGELILNGTLVPIGSMIIQRGTDFDVIPEGSNE